MNFAISGSKSFVSMPGRHAPPSRCKSTRRIRTTRRDWLRSFVPGGTGLFMFDSHRPRALLRARSQLIGMTTRLSNHIRGVLKTFGLLPGAMRGLPFDRKVEALLLNRSDVAPIVRPMLLAWRQLREQIAAFDKAIRVLVRSNSACRLLMSVPGIGVLSALAYVR